ncbi:MAG TPA: hypothetical protein VEZ20_15570 [Allosphingosinicella sp.]|jgi:hypothetical protein|nr:hypothetical protein [Allosphingosinicella sp.]
MRMRFPIALAALAGLAAAPAAACRIYNPGADLSVLHRALPPTLPPDLFVAEIEFEQPDAGWDELFSGTRARVRRLVRGHYRGGVVVVRDVEGLRIPCYPPVRDGGSGYLLATPIGFENGVLVVQPVFEKRGMRRR